jgi:hypothetical protein
MGGISLRVRLATRRRVTCVATMGSVRSRPTTHNDVRV